MRRAFLAAGLAASVLSCGAAAPASDPPPEWAFVIRHVVKDDATPPKSATVPGSKHQRDAS